MIRKDKVTLMTRLAIEKKKDSQYAFITEQFWAGDFLSTELWKAFVCLTAGYILVVLVGLIAYGDYWTVNFHIADVLSLAWILIRIYGAVLLLGLLICLLCHLYLYLNAYRKRQLVQKYLRHLSRLYEEE